MKLFIKDHLSFILLYVINFIFILLIIWLGGEYLSSQLIIYMFFLSLFILFIFLTIRYYKKATVYKTLSIQSSNLRNMKKGYKELICLLILLLIMKIKIIINS